MSRVKVKKISIPLGAKDEGVAQMFNQMLGTGTVNITIAYPRYKLICKLCDQLVRVFELMADSPFFRKHEEFANQTAQIHEFCEKSRTQLATKFFMDFSDYEWNLTLVEEDLQKRFSDMYSELKKSDIIHTFIIMCDHLVPYKKNFENIEKLSHKFITNMAGAEWCPFPFCTLNLKYIICLDSMTCSNKSFFMTILSKTYEFSRKLYEEIQSPDIDVDQFVDVIMKNITELQKRPELSRCRAAFQKIKESIALLKTNFTGYYRDFTSTKDSTIMMQHFIIDVSKTSKDSPQLASQFRTIISYYKKMAQNSITDPKVKMLLDRVNESMAAMERGTENLVNINEGDSEALLTQDDFDDADYIDCRAKSADSVTIPPGPTGD